MIFQEPSELSIRNLNQRAAHLTEFAKSRVRKACESESSEHGGVHVLDFGVQAEGGLEAGVLLARICLSGMADVEITPSDSQLADVPQVFVRTDHPVERVSDEPVCGFENRCR